MQSTQRILPHRSSGWTHLVLLVHMQTHARTHGQTDGQTELTYTDRHRPTDTDRQTLTLFDGLLHFTSTASLLHLYIHHSTSVDVCFVASPPSLFPHCRRCRQREPQHRHQRKQLSLRRHNMHPYCTVKSLQRPHSTHTQRTGDVSAAGAESYEKTRPQMAVERAKLNDASAYATWQQAQRPMPML